MWNNMKTGRNTAEDVQAHEEAWGRSTKPIIVLADWLRPLPAAEAHNYAAQAHNYWSAMPNSNYYYYYY